MEEGMILLTSVVTSSSLNSRRSVSVSFAIITSSWNYPRSSRRLDVDVYLSRLDDLKFTLTTTPRASFPTLSRGTCPTLRTSPDGLSFFDFSKLSASTTSPSTRYPYTTGSRSYTSSSNTTDAPGATSTSTSTAPRTTTSTSPSATAALQTVQAALDKGVCFKYISFDPPNLNSLNLLQHIVHDRLRLPPRKSCQCGLNAGTTGRTNQIKRWARSVR